MRQSAFLTTMLLGFLLLGCSLEEEVLVPNFGESEFISQTYPLNQSMKSRLEGVYRVEQGSTRFGKQVVVKWNDRYLTVFCGKDVGYIILEGGRLDSVFFFEGYWRCQTGSRTGLASLRIGKDEGGRNLMSGDTTDVRLIFRGVVGDGISAPSDRIVLAFERKLRPEAYATNYLILAHRGGGRTSDQMPHSENCVELIRMAERFGANGIEIDVRLTKDGVPVLYHDNGLNPRLVQKMPLVGPVEDFTFAQLRSFVRLINGEKIPSLEEALHTVLEETTLRFVWLDSKTEGRDLLSRVVPVQQQYLDRARLRGRELEIVIGIPTEAVLNEFRSLPSHQTIPSLCELSTRYVREVNANIWAPRWTLGPLDAEVMAMHAEGRRVVPWTLDHPEYVEHYVTHCLFDGILTNYPTIVAYYHYLR